jgi:signal transduction histidine kinase
MLTARALAPIDSMTSTAMSIASGERGLATRLGLPDTGDELGRLASTFDAMLERIETSFERERRFAADASHELRTPLAAVQAILGTAALKRRTVDEYERVLEDIALETERLSVLTEDLLALARGDPPRAWPAERVDLANLLRDVTETFQSRAQDKEIDLVCTVPDGLHVTGDSDTLIRLFVNLVDNAVKFTNPGGRVTVASEPTESSFVGVTVSDTGPGIAPSDLPHVFERFYQAERARSVPGTGLGLAIAHEIALAHGTRIEVTSELGEGSRFAIRLRRALDA